jgi:hypothetical protein
LSENENNRAETTNVQYIVNKFENLKDLDNSNKHRTRNISDKFNEMHSGAMFPKSHSTNIKKLKTGKCFYDVLNYLFFTKILI